MKKFFLQISGIFLILSLNCFAQESRINIHDPVMIKHKEKYYLFATGFGISVLSSPDMKNWTREEPVFSVSPQWVISIMNAYALSDTTIRSPRGGRMSMWAPDISFHNGQYYLYYSISAFGKNTSCLGLVTNKSLDPADPDFQWVDQGPVICSRPGIDNWNAIDPNLIIGEDGHPYLTWGSFWDGLQIARLTDDMKRIHPDSEPVTIVSRKTDPDAPNPPSIPERPVDAGGNAIEAPFIIRKGDYFYYMASFDYCCWGERSTYNVVYGRSKSVMGPYFDKEGKSMRTGCGTVLVKGDENWYAAGHNGFATIDGKDYIVFHAYDKKDKGQSKLYIFEIDWDNDGWMVMGKEIY